MSTTNSRVICSKCKKKNLSSWTYEGKNFTKCMTSGCDNKQTNSSESFISNINLDFRFPETSYRGISSKTCEFLGIKIAEIGENLIVSYDHNNLDGSFSLKRRYPGKVFDWKNKIPETSMFALDKCVDFNLPLIITEGNEDCATLWDLGYQAASLLSAGTEKSDIELSIDYINNFNEVWLCIEQDKAGKRVCENLKHLLAHKSLRQIDLSPRKDANEWIRDDILDLYPNRDTLKNKILDSNEIVPNGIIFGYQLDRTMYREVPPPAFDFFCKGLNDSLHGLERGCIYALYAGSTTGKSTWLRHQAYFLREKYPDIKVAMMFFEESQRITPQALIALDNKIALGDLKRDPTILSEEKFNQSWDKLINNDKLMFIDKNFKKDAEHLVQYIKYLVKVKHYDVIIIDHISYIIGRTVASKQGERKDIDKLIYDLQDLATELNCVIIYASHITDKDGKDSWDTGKVPDLYSGRGSKVLTQAPDGIIALSRNNTDLFLCDLLKVHCLKARWDGKLGLTDELVYVHSTGRLVYK